MAVQFARAGFSVMGIDQDTGRVRSVENVFRNVNIALVDELAMLCDRMGVDVSEVIEAAATTADCVVIHTDHDTVDHERLVAHARLVFDTRNATHDVRVDRTRVVRL